MAGFEEREYLETKNSTSFPAGSRTTSEAGRKHRKRTNITTEDNENSNLWSTRHPNKTKANN